MFSETCLEATDFSDGNLETILSITLETFVSLANFPVEAKTQGNVLTTRPNDISVLSILPLKSKGFVGSLSLYSNEKAFLNFYNCFFEEENSILDPEMGDAFSEILNVIYGQVKHEFNKIENFHFETSLPTLVVGKSLSVKNTTGDLESITIPLHKGSDILYFEILFKKNTEVASVS